MKRSRQRRASKHRPLRVVYDVQGPRVRLGVGWFLLELVALLGGHWTIAFLYAVTAAIAALQTAKAWRHVRVHPHRVTAGAGAAAIGMAGAMHDGIGRRRDPRSLSRPRSSSAHEQRGGDYRRSDRRRVVHGPLRALSWASRPRASRSARGSSSAPSSGSCSSSARTRRATTSSGRARATPSRARSPAIAAVDRDDVRNRCARHQTVPVPASVRVRCARLGVVPRRPVGRVRRAAVERGAGERATPG